MIYQEYKPREQLTPFIDTYWASEGFVEGQELFNVLPDGCVDIMFSFGCPSKFAFGYPSVKDSLTLLLPNIIGTMTTYSEVCYNGKVSMLGIRFKPVGITAFTRVPVNEFTNQRIDMTLVETLFDEQFYESLPEKKSMKQRIEHIDAYFAQKLKSIFAPQQQIVYAVNLIQKTKGRLSLAEVASEACLSPRHFERKFKSAVGISPKAFSKVVKFKHAISFLNEHKDESIFSIAVDCGYYDHTHMIKDFKSLSGNTPSFYRG